MNEGAKIRSMQTEVPSLSHTHPRSSIPAVSPFPEDAWQQVLRRDRAADGEFVYAVSSTGVYCRPSCASRRPRRSRVAFYASPAEAEAAGFRACLRCHPNRGKEAAEHPHAAAVERVVTLLRANAGEPLPLEKLSGAAGISRFALLRAFKTILGVTPAAIARQLRRQNLRDTLINPTGSITDALYAAGFGSSSRLYENSGETLGMHPSTIKAHGKGAHIHFVTADSPLGRMLVARTALGICAVAFGDDDADLERDLRARFHAAACIEHAGAELDQSVHSVLSAMLEPEAAAALPLDVRHTAFRERAWRALRAIPRGETRTYGEIATALGDRNAARAVGTACAENPVAVLIPCHRVLAAKATSENWRWGVQRKRLLLQMEHTSSASNSNAPHPDARS